MPKFKYNPNNTEGHHPTSFDFVDTEVKKGEKIVATDLVDLYDTYPESQTPNQGDGLMYDGNDGIWKPGESIGEEICNIFTGYSHSEYNPNSVFVNANDGWTPHSGVNANTTINGTGTYHDPFKTLKYCFEYLNRCKTIPDEITLTIQILSNIIITEPTSLNHPQGYNIEINGNGFSIVNQNIISEDTQNNITTYSSPALLSISGNHSIKLLNDVKLDFDIDVGVVDYDIPIYSIEIDDKSSISCIDVILSDTSFFGIHTKSILANNKSIIRMIELTSTNKITTNNSLMIVDNITTIIEWNLWNDSTLIINKKPSVYPTIDNHESTYIINGVIQP